MYEAGTRELYQPIQSYMCKKGSYMSVVYRYIQQIYIY